MVVTLVSKFKQPLSNILQSYDYYDKINFDNDRSFWFV